MTNSTPLLLVGLLACVSCHSDATPRALVSPAQPVHVQGSIWQVPSTSVKDRSVGAPPVASAQSGSPDRNGTAALRPPQQNDLSLLPAPFYDPSVDLEPSIPVHFLSHPSAQALRAAGIVASYFGIVARDHPPFFPVSIGTIPPGNSIVISEDAAELPAALSIASGLGATLSLRTNPGDPNAKLLIVAGDSSEDVVTAAQSLALQRNLPQGDQQHHLKLAKLVIREPDDAPRWLSTNRINIDGIPHLAVLPNLEVFAKAGYPFTRKADLADTVVVLPDVPTAEEIEIYLTLMGHFGTQTGYPVLNVGIAGSGDMKEDRRKDYLILGSFKDQPAFARLNASLPVSIVDNTLHIRDIHALHAPLQHAWWKVPSSDRLSSGEFDTSGRLPDALIEGIEWPSGSSRSVVLLLFRDATVVPNFLRIFLKSSQTSDIAQSVSVLHGNHFVSYRIGGQVYRVGSLPPWIRLDLLFSEFPWLVVVTTTLVCIFLAAFIRAMLRRHARIRLQGTG